MSNEIDYFFSLIGNLYKKRDGILEHTNTIIDYAYKIEAQDTDETLEKVIKGTFDNSEIKDIFSNTQKEINYILSVANELKPHLNNPALIPQLSLGSYSIIMLMNMTDKVTMFKLKEISLSLQLFANMANKLTLNPTKKSIKQAFGIEVGLPWAKVKAYIEKSNSNFLNL